MRNSFHVWLLRGNRRESPGQGCAFLEKPFLPDELVGRVHELLKGEAAA